MTNLFKDLQEIKEALLEAYENVNDQELIEFLENDILDLEYRCNAQKKYKSVKLALTLGGPNIYLDTLSGTLKGYWGNEHFEISIDDQVNQFIDDYFCELFECM